MTPTVRLIEASGFAAHVQRINMAVVGVVEKERVPVTVEKPEEIELVAEEAQPVKDDGVGSDPFVQVAEVFAAHTPEDQQNVLTALVRSAHPEVRTYFNELFGGARQETRVDELRAEIEAKTLEKDIDGWVVDLQISTARRGNSTFCKVPLNLRYIDEKIRQGLRVVGLYPADHNFGTIEERRTSLRAGVKQ